MRSRTTRGTTTELRDPRAMLNDVRAYLRKRTPEFDAARARREEAAASLEKAKGKYEDADARYELLKEEISGLANQEAFWAREAGVESLSDASQPAGPKPGGPTAPHSPPGRIHYADRAQPVLEAAGHGLTTKEIVRALVRAGHIPNGKEHDHMSAAYASMARRKGIFMRNNGHWELVGRGDDRATNARD